MQGQENAHRRVANWRSPPRLRHRLWRADPQSLRAAPVGLRAPILRLEDDRRESTDPMCSTNTDRVSRPPNLHAPGRPAMRCAGLADEGEALSGSTNRLWGSALHSLSANGPEEDPGPRLWRTVRQSLSEPRVERSEAGPRFRSLECRRKGDTPHTSDTHSP